MRAKRKRPKFKESGPECTERERGIESKNELEREIERERGKKDHRRERILLEH